MEIKNMLKKWWFWVLIVILIIPYIFMISTMIKPKFEITDFSITSDTTDYTSIANTTSYSGDGLITTSDKNGVYIVALKITLKSGGGENSEKEVVDFVIVSDGKGKFSTYDYGEEGSIQKPNYDFEVVGSQKLN